MQLDKKTRGHCSGELIGVAQQACIFLYSLLLIIWLKYQHYNVTTFNKIVM